jgi:hypothetical protein
MKIFGFRLDNALLTTAEQSYIRTWSQDSPPPVEMIWAAMDAAWEELGASSSIADSASMDAFYRHPIWLVNGIFTEVDPVSIGHREAIALEVAKAKPTVVCDYGGGFGALARRIAALLPRARVEIVEPYPHPTARILAQRYPNLAFVDRLPQRSDVVIAQDVLEHVTQPIALMAKLSSLLDAEGVFITASCFQPVIKCHLPETFHLLQTFRYCVAPLGLDLLQIVPGAAHAEVYLRNTMTPNPSRALRREWASRGLFPISRKLQRWASRLL